MFSRREIRSLIKGAELFRVRNLKIVTWDYENSKIVDNHKI